MKTIVLREGTPLGQALGEAGEEVLVLRDGHAVALVVPFNDDDAEWYAREQDPDFVASIADARNQVEQGRTISHEEVKARLGIT